MNVQYYLKKQEALEFVNGIIDIMLIELKKCNQEWIDLQLRDGGIKRTTGYLWWKKIEYWTLEELEADCAEHRFRGCWYNHWLKWDLPTMENHKHNISMLSDDAMYLIDTTRHGF